MILKTNFWAHKNMKIIDGKKISQEILARVEKEVALLPFTPVFCDVLVGANVVSEKYVKMKARRAKEVGINFHEATFRESITTEELIKEIQELNRVGNMCGVIVQLPLPEHIDIQKVLDTIKPNLDVDCLGTVNSEKFYAGEPLHSFPTALACMAVLDYLDLDLKTKKIAVLGRGKLVGRPVAAMLSFRGLSPEVVNRSTPNKKEIIKRADVIISGFGSPEYIKGDMIKEGAVLIDAGTSEAGDSIKGDVDFESVRGVAKAISPVPGGVGPVTVAMLLRNVLQVAKDKSNER